ncbi:MAG TPA: hypothetical protein VLH61_03430 [Bacteroidales bacterium]|nr:hypothetical protein [Bacteroidales bacterium]
MKSHHRTGSGGIDKAAADWEDSDVIQIGEGILLNPKTYGQ